MSITINRKKAVKPAPSIAQEPVKETVAPINIDTPENWNPQLVDESKIDLSPRNYRENVTDEDVKDLAAQMKNIGFIIEAVTVRPGADGRFELVVGERRLRAARLAGIRYIPCVVRLLADEEVDEIQWTENHHRKDPHPMLEARRMSAMLSARQYTVEELAARAGKPVNYVYSRIRLTKLIPAFQEMYLVDTLTTKEALLISGLSVESQQLLYDENGKHWEQHKRVTYYSLESLIDKFKRLLSKAPFDATKDDLIPDAKGCGGCPFNTANKLNQLLFPDGNTNGYCTNRQCFDRKCKASLLLTVQTAVSEKTIAGLIIHEADQPTVKPEIDKMLGIQEVTCYDAGKITRMEEPVVNKHLLANCYTTQEKKRAKVLFKHQQDELKLFHARVNEGKILRGLYIYNGVATPTFFVTGLPPKSKPVIDPDRMTKAQVSDAIKAGLATPDMINKELSKMAEREKTAQRKDRCDMAEEMVKQLLTRMEAATKAKSFTPAPVDQLATYFLLFHTLSSSLMDVAAKYLWNTSTYKLEGEALFEKLKTLTDKQRCFLIRFAFMKYEPARQPTSWGHPILRMLATTMGVDLKAIEKNQSSIAVKRQQNSQHSQQTLKNALKSLSKKKSTQK